MMDDARLHLQKTKIGASVTFILLFDEIIYYGYSSNFQANSTDQFFQPSSMDCIVKAALRQKKSAHKTISVGLDMLFTSFFKMKI